LKENPKFEEQMLNHSYSCLCGYTFCFGCGEKYDSGCCCGSGEDSDNDGEGPDYYRCSGCGTVAVYGNSCNCADGVPKPDYRDRGHVGWDIVQGAGVCVRCGEEMKEFLMECRDSSLRACRLCMRHKL
jgi:hypothetical protein